MLFCLVVSLTAICAGIVQTVTGFGAGIVLMIAMPHFFDMVAASAITSAINLGLTTTLVWRYHKFVQIELLIMPTLVYTLSAIVIINFLSFFNLKGLSIAFGIFLLLLSLYYLVFAEHTSGSQKWWIVFLCSLVSGISSGLFGIGGPLMATCFLAMTDNHDSYTGNLQFLFLIAGIFNLFTRVVNGIYTVEMLPLTLLCCLFINVGKRLGIAIAGRMNTQMIKKIVYLFVGLSGIMVLSENLL